MFNVAAALGAIVELARVRSQGLQGLENFVERDSAPGRDVEDLSRRALSRRLAGQQIRLDYIVDVSKIAALFSVAKDGWRLPVEHLHNELGHHSRILRRRILPRPEYVEIPQGHSLQLVAA